jgi:hypothetical protein
MAKDTKPADAPTLSPELEVERLRLQNENLKLQLEIENKRNPPSPDSLIEEQLERQRSEQQQALDDLMTGPFKFHVHLPGNYATTHPRHAPHLVVGAQLAGQAGLAEAIKKYNAHMGIVTPAPHLKYQVSEVGGPVQEVGTAAAAQVDFKPADITPAA